MKDATVMEDWAGLRPYRCPLRLEREVIKYGDKTLQVCKTKTLIDPYTTTSKQLTFL